MFFFSIIIPQEDRVKVRAGDVVGIHYDSSDSTGIVPYADSRDDYGAFGLSKG